ncbi:DPP IV N-terminal domain-containing protein [Sinosporangium siamense]|uniref:Dipeptidyl peptidase IV n=1 Tax=Sinosporangium siamense TaxID=1367973 RepID=A0A919RFN7_9ACTN|nr:DPP IV N-terminal domain-containing protein [Sinosporangium siamense]GII91925.1 putative dipeptidyl peptidase IV [Sinosporangium siamense]
MIDRYRRAERLHMSRHDQLVFRALVTPHWEGDSFWYKVNTPEGPEFVRVWPEKRERQVIADPGAEEAPPPMITGLVTSPDGRYAVGVEGENLTVNGTPVTADGVAGWGYGLPSDQSRMPVVARQQGLRTPPLVVFAPGGRRFVTCRVDQRHVPTLTLTQSCPPGAGQPRPLVHTMHYEMPGDEPPTITHLILDAETGERVDVDIEPLTFTHDAPLGVERVWWSDDDTLWLLYSTRGYKSARLYRIDARTGAACVVLEETAETIMHYSPTVIDFPLVRTFGDEVLWFSERDGWGHLYLYRDGELVCQVTRGEWLVRAIVHLDEERRELYFLAGGHDPNPYHRGLFRVGLDGTGLTRLTPEQADHDVTASPDGRWFVDTYATPAEPPVTVLRDRDGTVVLELERADIRRLLEAGWRAPEPFTVKAADGVTDVHGLLYLPGDFDPSASYPILDSVYNGGQLPRLARLNLRGYPVDPYLLDQAAGAPMFAQLGLAVVVLDGRGTPYRSKAFHDAGYGDPTLRVGLADHVAALTQLAADRPYLDLGRVGIAGHSGGGTATAAALLHHPGVFHVGVASAGNYETAGYYALWGETYGGPPPRDYDQWSLVPHAAGLKGKLLLLCGEMDDNTHPTLTLRLVDALIRADKDFDMLMVPGAAHGYLHAESHVLRRQWDYLVRHLLGEEPPTGFTLTLEG